MRSYLFLARNWMYEKLTSESNEQKLEYFSIVHVEAINFSGGLSLLEVFMYVGKETSCINTRYSLNLLLCT